MNKQRIITHPGGAHFDEMTAISFILAIHNNEKFSIERREPSISELDDPHVWVIDIGNRYEPEKLNFDHHQDQNCPSAFVLVADYLGLLEIMSIQLWWQFKDSVDRIGPARSSIQYKAGDDLINRNPIEIWMTSRFASDPEACLPMLKSFGTQLIGDARMLKKQIDFWKSSRRLMIAGLPAMIGETKESLGLEEFRRLEKNPPDIVISLDRRGEGWRLFRFDGAPVDFSLITDHPEISFAHKSGFQATTRERLSIDEVITLVSKAVIAHQ
jgi:hypothetical protein